MVEAGIRVMLGLGSLDCLSPSTPFGAFDTNIWMGFGQWLIEAEVLPLAGGRAAVSAEHSGVICPPSERSSSGASCLTALCSEAGGVWTNKFRMALPANP